MICGNCAARTDDPDHACPSDDVRCLQIRARVDTLASLLARSHALLEMQDKQPKKLLREIEAALSWDTPSVEQK